MNELFKRRLTSANVGVYETTALPQISSDFVLVANVALAIWLQLARYVLFDLAVRLDLQVIILTLILVKSGSTTIKASFPHAAVKSGTAGS